MKLTNKEIAALRYRYEKMCRGILGAPFRVLEAGPGELGSTVPANIIYLGFNHEFFKELDKKHTVFMIDGTYSHEVMHKILSDFSSITIGASKYSLSMEKRIFKVINNIMEDAFIEYHAPEFLGDMLIRALNYMRAVVYSNTPPIDNLDESGNAPDDLSQFFNACIQYGDAGLIKGSFTNPDTREIFVKALPVMEAHMHEPNPRKRVEYVHEVLELTRPMWMEDAKMEKLLRKMMEKMAKEGRNMSDPSGGGMGGSSMARASSDCSESDSSDKASRRKMTSAKMKSSSKAGNSSGKPSGSSESAEESPSGCGGKTDPSGNEERSASKENASEGTSGSSSGSDPESAESSDSAKSSSKSSSKDDGAGDEESEDGSESESDSGSYDDSENTDSSDAADTSDSGEGTTGESTDGDGPDDGSEGSDPFDPSDTSGSEDGGDGKESDSSDSGSDSADSNEEAGEKADGDSSDSEDADRDNGELSEDGSEEGSESEEDGGMTPAQALRSAMEEMEVSADDLDATGKELESAVRAVEAENSETKEDHAVNLDFPVKGGYKKSCDKATCKNIKMKVSPSKRDELAAQYAGVVSSMQSGINHLANQLKRILRNDRSEKVYKTSGKISIERLASGRLTANMFTKRRDPHNKCDADIFILSDESGSMGWGGKSQLCRAATIALAEALSQLSLSLSIVGFTADCNGASAVHHHYMNGKNTKETRLSLMNISANSNNYDGYSIRYATEYLKRRSSEHKLLIVISDGQPACSAYGYGGTNGVQDTAMAIRDASKYFPVIGVLIGNENPEVHRTMYGYNFIHISDPNDLFSGLAKTIARQIKNW